MSRDAVPGTGLGLTQCGTEPGRRMSPRPGKQAHGLFTKQHVETGG